MPKHNLKELYQLFGGGRTDEQWSDRFACFESDARQTLEANRLRHRLSVFVFTLILRGTLEVETEGVITRFEPGDLCVFMTGFPVRVAAVSSDYAGICLMADERATYETPAFRDIVRTSRFPLLRHVQLRLTLPPAEAWRLHQLMVTMRAYIMNPTPSSGRILEMLYSVLLLQLSDFRATTSNSHLLPPRVLELFTTFYTHLRQHFTTHHDIAFYASLLHISPTYLSRIVRQATGRTVSQCVNQMLAAEATALLATPGLTISQVADRLAFSSTSAFNKFFSRMRGISPKAYRQQVS